MKFKKNLIFFLIISLFVSSPVNLAYSQSAFFDNATVTACVSTDKKTVIPVGKCVGVTLSIDGVMITGTSEIECVDGTKCSPAKDAGLENGDIIKKYNNTVITDTEKLKKAISQSAESANEINILRDGRVITSSIVPRTSKDDNELKIGAWIKDATSGIGTLTFYDPETKYFAALGHGIYSPTEGSILNIDGGELLPSTIVDISKSKKGNPGELKGVFSENSKAIGQVTKNTDFGIRGLISETNEFTNNPVEIATKNEIKPGKAYIYSNIEGSIIGKFEIEILRVIPDSEKTSKNMIIKITDKRLIKKTGGIVQGMSGSPVIQNGKLVGAVTHVFVNDPTRGYGIFIENMLSEAEKIK